MVGSNPTDTTINLIINLKMANRGRHRKKQLHINTITITHDQIIEYLWDTHLHRIGQGASSKQIYNFFRKPYEPRKT